MIGGGGVANFLLSASHKSSLDMQAKMQARLAKQLNYSIEGPLPPVSSDGEQALSAYDSSQIPAGITARRIAELSISRTEEPAAGDSYLTRQSGGSASSTEPRDRREAETGDSYLTRSSATSPVPAAVPGSESLGEHSKSIVQPRHAFAEAMRKVRTERRNQSLEAARRFGGGTSGAMHTKSPSGYYQVGFAGTRSIEYPYLVDWLRSEVKSAGEHTKRVALIARGDYAVIIKFFLKVMRIVFCDERVDFTIGPFGSLLYGGYHPSQSDFDIQVLLSPNGRSYTEEAKENLCNEVLSRVQEVLTKLDCIGFDRHPFFLAHAHRKGKSTIALSFAGRKCDLRGDLASDPGTPRGASTHSFV